MNQVNISQWKAMFQEAGIDEQRANRWHSVFEASNSEGHQSFLEWLGLSAEQIKDIRQASK